MLKKVFKILFIVIIIIFNLYLKFDNILLVNSQDKERLIYMHNLPTNSKILLVKGRHTSLSNTWPIIVYYKTDLKIQKETLYDGFNEGDETHVLAVTLHQNSIIKIIFSFEIIIIILYFIKKKITNK